MSYTQYLLIEMHYSTNVTKRGRYRMGYSNIGPVRIFGPHNGRDRYTAEMAPCIANHEAGIAGAHVGATATLKAMNAMISNLEIKAYAKEKPEDADRYYVKVAG